MEPRTLTSTVTIEADAQQVWRVLADEFIDVAAWGPGVNSSGPNPETPEGLNGSRYGGRVCEVEGVGPVHERIVAYDDQARTLSYTVAAKNRPDFVEKVQNTWTVNPDDTNRSTVDTRLEVTIADSMSESDADTIVKTMFAGASGASTNLKTYIESSH
ncbi:MAG: SRPBCC family protein [Acidimicrobiia bacterium]